MSETPNHRPGARWLRLVAIAAAAAITLAGCGGRHTFTVTTTSTGPAVSQLPGTGKPALTIGDKNFTEQFLLGELYFLALQAQGYTVSLNRNIGPPEVTMRALATGALSMYPEYVDMWNANVAGDHDHYATSRAAYRAAQDYAEAHGYELLRPTPFSDTQALAVDFNYGVQHGLSSMADLRKVSSSLTLGGPPQFQQDPAGLPALTRAYRFSPAGFKPLEVGGQYQALDQGLVQAADVNTTDGQLITGNYTLLADPLKVFGWGNVIPVVPAKVIDEEGPSFVKTINRVSALLTTTAMRQMNAAVDLDNQDPVVVATQFLQAHGLLAAPPSP